MKSVLASLLTLAALTSAYGEQTNIGYRFDEVKRTVTLTSAKQAVPAAKGLRAKSGDKVHTGWFSYALIATELYRARFEIFAMTDVELAGTSPGLLLTVERGRLRAMFDKMAGTEPRVVKTPGALLAVRGTKFDVEVDKTGRTRLDVFEGIVEVRSEFRREPLMVKAGQESVFGRREAPEAHNMPEDRRRMGPNERGEGAHGGQRPEDGGDHPGEHGGEPGHGGERPSQPPPSHMPPPPPPPHHP